MPFVLLLLTGAVVAASFLAVLALLFYRAARRALLVGPIELLATAPSARPGEAIEVRARVGARRTVLEVVATLTCTMFDHRLRRIFNRQVAMVPAPDRPGELVGTLKVPSHALRSGTVGDHLSSLFSEEARRLLVCWTVGLEVRSAKGTVLARRTHNLEVPEGAPLETDRGFMERLVVDSFAALHDDLLFHWMVKLAAHDGVISPEERALLHEVLRRGHGITDGVLADQRIDEDLRSKLQLDPVLIRAHVPPEQRVELYRLLFALAWRDGVLEKRESAFLGEMLERFGLDPHQVREVELEVLRARAQSQLTDEDSIAEGRARNPRHPKMRGALLALFASLAIFPSLAQAHERWVPHQARPFDRHFFQSMSGEVLDYSLMATLGIAALIAAWYLLVVPLVERLTPANPRELAALAALPSLKRKIRGLILFLLDAEIDTPWIERGERAAAWLFAKIPAGVFALGVFQHWFVLPSFPVSGRGGDVLRVVEALLAVWVASGLWKRALGAVLVLVFGFLCGAFGVAAFDGIPILASAAFYWHATPDGHINSRQLTGIRLGVGLGVFLLGLVNKVWVAELFIGVGDSHPQLLEGARHLMPHLSREAFSYLSALGEMTFGLMLVLGLFDKLTTLALSLIMTSVMHTFGLAEIVHLYPVAGFLVLLFHAPPGTVLDGVLFRTHIGLWRAAGRRGTSATFSLGALVVAGVAAFLLMFVPLLITVEILPRLMQ